MLEPSNNAAFFLPGWGVGASACRDLPEKNWQFIELPGYGDSPIISEFDAAVQWIAEQLPPASHLGGWSLGAMLALAVAARYPEHVSQLTLYAPTPSFIVRQATPEQTQWDFGRDQAELAAFAAAINASNDEELQLLKGRFIGQFNRGDKYARALTEHLLKISAPLPPKQVLLNGLNWLATVDLRQDIRLIEQPTVVVHGESDPLIPLDAGIWLTKQLKNATINIVAERAHAPFIEL